MELDSFPSVGAVADLHQYSCRETAAAEVVDLLDLTFLEMVEGEVEVVVHLLLSSSGAPLVQDLERRLVSILFSREQSKRSEGEASGSERVTRADLTWHGRRRRRYISYARADDVNAHRKVSSVKLPGGGGGGGGIEPGSGGGGGMFPIDGGMGGAGGGGIPPIDGGKGGGGGGPVPEGAVLDEDSPKMSANCLLIASAVSLST